MLTELQDTKWHTERCARTELRGELYQKLAWPFSHASPVMLAQRWPLTFTCQSMELRERGWTCGHGHRCGETEHGETGGSMREEQKGAKGQEQFKEAGERTMAPWAAAPTTNDAAETRRKAISLSSQNVDWT